MLVIPDATRTAPVGALFQALHECLGGVAARLDVMVALGTHQPMTEEAICRRLEITPEQHRDAYRAVNLFNHAWDDPEALRVIGTIPIQP